MNVTNKNLLRMIFVHDELYDEYENFMWALCNAIYKKSTAADVTTQ